MGLKLKNSATLDKPLTCCKSVALLNTGLILLRLVHNIRSSKRSVICLHRVATGSTYKMIWMRIVYAGIEIISIPAYAHVAMRVQIILYALPVATLAQAYIVNQPLVEQKNNKELDSIFTHSRPVAPFFFGWQLQVMQLHCWPWRNYSDCTNMHKAYSGRSPR